MASPPPRGVATCLAKVDASKTLTLSEKAAARAKMQHEYTALRTAARAYQKKMSTSKSTSKTSTPTKRKMAAVLLRIFGDDDPRRDAVRCAFLMKRAVPHKNTARRRPTPSASRQRSRRATRAKPAPPPIYGTPAYLRLIKAKLMDLDGHGGMVVDTSDAAVDKHVRQSPPNIRTQRGRRWMEESLKPQSTVLEPYRYVPKKSA